MKIIKNNLRIILLIVMILPLAIFFSSCDNDNDNLLTFQNITFTSQTIDYDGNEHEIVINGELPQDATVSYTTNVAINSGVYQATAVIACEGYKTLTLNATLTINKLNYDMSLVNWNYDSAFTYDKTEKIVLLNTTNLPEGVSVESYSNNKATNAGNYTATVQFNYDTLNHNAPSISNCNYTINKATFDTSLMVWNYDSAFTYDGTEKEVKLINIPEGVSATYSNNKAINVGDYTASVIFDYDKTNYNTVSISNCSYTINKANITNISFDNDTVEYDSLEHSIQPVGNIPANSNVKITYNDQEVTGVSQVGTYTVKLTITNSNYNTYQTSAILNIVSTEEKLYATMFNDKLYFQNNLDDNKFYCYDGESIEKINNDKSEYFTVNGDNLYYYSSSLFSRVIKCYNGTTASNLIEINGEYLTCDGTYIYYAVNNLLQTGNNGIYKCNLSGADSAIRLVKNKAEYLTYYDGKIYYSNVSDGGKLYSISTSSVDQDNGTLVYDEKVSDIILDSGVLYFNSSITQLGVSVASAIRKYNISTNTCIKLTTDNGKYLTKIGSYIYYINKDKITSNIFGDGIYSVSVLKDTDSNSAGTKVIATEDNGFSSLSSNGNSLYYYKLNDKHIYSYDLSTSQEVDLMADFVVPEETGAVSGFAKTAEYNGEIYYINTLDDGCLYKYSTVTKAKYKVLANSVSNVYFYNGYMYYSTYVVTNFALWRMNLITNETEKISSSRCDNLIFDDQTIYYVKVGSAYNNYIMKMDLDGQNVTQLYKDKNLWVASFEKVGEDIYFTINPAVGYKYVYKYNTVSNTGISLGLRSNYISISNGILYYYNISNDSLCSYNLSTAQEMTLVTDVKINNMIIADNYLYYSTCKSSNIGLYKYNLSTAENSILSDKCADGLIQVNGKIYFIQTAISYTNDYPSNSNGDGKLYCYDGQIVAL